MNGVAFMTLFNYVVKHAAHFAEVSWTGSGATPA